MKNRMLKVIVRFILLMSSACLLSCSSDGGPSVAQQEQSFTSGLPAFLSTQSFEIRSSEKIKDGEELLYNNQFHARLQLTADTYAIVDRDIDTVIVRKITTQGDIVDVFGTTECKLHQGNWQLAAELEESPIERFGVPWDTLANSASRIILDGTEEALEYRSEKAKRITTQKKARRAMEPDHVVVQHILIGFQGTVSKKRITRTREQARVLAEGLLQRAKEGEDFDSMVEMYSDADYPGIYAIANSGVMPDNSKDEQRRSKLARGFGDVSFSLQVGEIGMAAYDPLNSPYGWHIIKRLDDEDNRAGHHAH